MLITMALCKVIGRHFGHQVLAVQGRDISQGDAGWAFGRAQADVETGPEAFLVQLGHRVFGAALAFGLPLGQQDQLHHLSPYEEHGRRVFAGCHAQQLFGIWPVITASFRAGSGNYVMLSVNSSKH
jgi:hypothetical protein